VGALAKKMIQAWGSGSIKDVSPKSDFHEAGLLSLDCSKARYRLDWDPTLTLDETVNFTIRWYREFIDGKNMFELANEQIRDYTKRAQKRGIKWAIL
jgi:CDP-glucose 4,6-dehydratase